MKLKTISEFDFSSASSRRDKLTRTMANAEVKPAAEQKISFYELPQRVQFAYLAQYPYESVKEAMIIPPSKNNRNPIYIVRNKEWMEYGFNVDGTEYIPDDMRIDV